MENLGNTRGPEPFGILLLGTIACVLLTLVLSAGVLSFAVFAVALMAIGISSEYIGWAYLCLLAIILGIALIVYRLKISNRPKAPFAHKNDTLRGPAAGRSAQGEADAGSKQGKRNEAIKAAETSLDIWTLIVQLQGPEAGDRISAIRKLRGHNTPEVEEELTKAMLEDGYVAVRYEAYLALKFQGKNKLGLLLEKLKAVGDTAAKLSLLELLRKTGDTGQVETLIYLYDFETDKLVKLSILESLGKFYHFGVRDMAISILGKEEDRDVRLRAIEALRWYEDSNTRGILWQLRGDPDPDIRNSADRALESLELRI